MELGNSVQDTEVIINGIFQAFQQELEEILILNKDDRQLSVHLDENTLISDDAGNRKPLLSINYNQNKITAKIYKRVFIESVFPMVRLNLTLWKRLISEMAWHEYAHTKTFPPEIDEKSCSYLSMIYTDFLANYHVKHCFNKPVPCILAQLKDTFGFLKSKFNSMKRTVKKGFNPKVKYRNMLFGLLELCTVFYVNGAWKDLQPHFEQKKLTNYLKYLEKINQFFLQVTELNSDYVKKYQIVNKFSSIFSEDTCFEILSKLFLEKKEIHYPSREMISQILQM